MDAPLDAPLDRAAEMVAQLRAALAARPGAPGHESVSSGLAGEEASARARAALIEALSRCGEGEAALALLPFVPERAYLGQRIKLLQHLPDAELLPLAEELLALRRESRRWLSPWSRRPEIEALGARV